MADASTVAGAKKGERENKTKRSEESKLKVKRRGTK